MLEIHETQYANTTLLVLTGQFDHKSTAGMEPLIVGAQELGYTHLILDFSGITGIDSVGLGRLFLWYHMMQPHHVRLSIVNPLPRIRSVLEQSHMSKLIPIEYADGEIAKSGTTMKAG